jgi:hypothetical protein
MIPPPIMNALKTIYIEFDTDTDQKINWLEFREYLKKKSGSISEEEIKYLFIDILSYNKIEDVIELKHFQNWIQHQMELDEQEALSNKLTQNGIELIRNIIMKKAFGMPPNSMPPNGMPPASNPLNLETNVNLFENSEPNYKRIQCNIYNNEPIDEINEFNLEYDFNFLVEKNEKLENDIIFEIKLEKLTKNIQLKNINNKLSKIGIKFSFNKNILVGTLNLEKFFTYMFPSNSSNMRSQFDYFLEMISSVIYLLKFGLTFIKKKDEKISEIKISDIIKKIFNIYVIFVWDSNKIPMDFKMMENFIQALDINIGINKGNAIFNNLMTILDIPAPPIDVSRSPISIYDIALSEIPSWKLYKINPGISKPKTMDIKPKDMDIDEKNNLIFKKEDTLGESDKFTEDIIKSMGLSEKDVKLGDITINDLYKRLVSNVLINLYKSEKDKGLVNNLLVLNNSDILGFSIKIHDLKISLNIGN